MKKAKAQWRDRKIETRRMRVGDILPHPMNPKIHPENQLAPLRGLLDTVGKLDDLKAYHSERAGGALVFFDGHGRQSLDPNAEWDVDVYDLTDAEADLAVATFDPIGWQAEQSRVKLDELLREVSTGNEALLGLLANEAAKQNLYTESQSVSEIEDDGEHGEDFGDDPVPSDEMGVYAFREDMVFPATNRWGLPDLRTDRLSDLCPQTIFDGVNVGEPQDTLFIFRTAKVRDELKGAVLGFYVDDWRFEGVWTDAVRYVEQFVSFGWGAVIAPDFSVWRDDPLAVQLFNIYRSRWCARYWQEAGIDVIPSLNWSDERSYEWAFDGLPMNAPVVSVQCRTTRSRKGKEYFARGIAAGIERLHPQNVLIYGGLDHHELMEPELPAGPKYYFLDSWASIRKRRIRLSAQTQ